MEKRIPSHALAWNQAPDLGKNLLADQRAAWRGEQSPRAASQGRVPVDSVGTPHPWGVALSDIQPRGDEYVDNYAWMWITFLQKECSLLDSQRWQEFLATVTM